MSEHRDVVIVGGGPAGLSAAVYAARARLNPLVLETYTTPSQAVLTDLLENMPGFPEGISGFEFVESLKKQAQKFGAVLRNAAVSRVQREAHGFALETEEGVVRSGAVIIATGQQWRPLGVEGESALVGKGVSYCGVCDAPIFKGKACVVVGGGNTALQEALYIARFASQVHLVHRRTQFRGSPVLVERVRGTPNIEIVVPAVVESLRAGARLEAVLVRDVGTGRTREIACDGLFVFVGRVPNTSFLRGMAGMDDVGYLTTDVYLATTVPGMFAAGDCRVTPLRQVVTACADGALAAESVYHHLQRAGHT
jgi:thioredoxin reductase (NADPH)